MCHLAGYIGNDNVIPTILDSLEIQEPIIGAQATGLAFFTSEMNVALKKEIGSVKHFKHRNKSSLESNVGIGHTRFAVKNITYAETNTKEKAHPFWNSDKTFAIMHNGTITNFLEYVKPLEKKGYQFRSKSEFRNKDYELRIDYCDSEIIGFLLEEELKTGTEIKEAIRKISEGFQGQYAYVVLHPEYPKKIFIANWMQPLFIGKDNTSSFFASFKEGFHSLNNKLSPIKPQKNALITLSSGKYTIEPLHPQKKLDSIDLNQVLLEEFILKSLNDDINDVASIWMNIKNNPTEVGLTSDIYNEKAIIGGYSFSPIIYQKLQQLLAEEKITRKLELVWEGGIADTPRYKYYFP